MFKEITNNSAHFFAILPKDWQDSIVPYWNFYTNKAKIYIIEEEKEICAGGIVFYSPSPDMGNFYKEAVYWHQKGYAYIGYVWVPENKRNKNYGSIWLKELVEKDNKQHYWLTTEDKKLQYFYEKNGFKFYKTLVAEKIEEYLFVL